MSKEFSAKNADIRLEETRVNSIIGKPKTEEDASSKYFSFMTRKAKVEQAEASGTLSTAEAKSINSLGDLQKWELKVLARLYQLGDNSPELLQILAYTKTDNREDCATVVARKQYKKQLVELSINKLLGADEVKADVKASSDKSRTAITTNAVGL